MSFALFSIEFVALANVLLSLITLGAFIYARRRFFPGLFKNLLDMLIIVVFFLLWEQALKFMAALNLQTYDTIFQVSIIHPMLVNVLFLLIAYRAVKMSEVYGFAKNPIVKPVDVNAKPNAAAAKRTRARRRK